MKNLILMVALSITGFVANAQDSAKLYHPNANAEADIADALKKAKAEKKYVLLQAGGNWCRWCIEFARFAKAEPKVDSVMNANFIWYHLNYSKENENKAVFAKYGYAQRFGFPVFIILNEKGERIHTQNSEYLEDGKRSYDPYKVRMFLEMWGPKALDPKQYK
ncbi:MAG: thioredoxin family protein [Ferruginibacter sp.]|nr:thioredoxin family protein [Ferruginibacter sp.]